MKHFFIILTFLVCSFPTTAQQEIWQITPETSEMQSQERIIEPLEYIVCQFDEKELKEILGQAEQAGSAELPIINPDGEIEVFNIQPANLFHKDLSEKYPNLKYFKGRSLSNFQNFIRLDLTPHGFHAMVFGGKNGYYIDPYHINDSKNHIIYYKNNFKTNKKANPCHHIETEDIPTDHLYEKNTSFKIIGDSLRHYRMAIGTNWNYTNYFGGTIPDALAAMGTTLNRVTGIYERELAITFSLVPETDSLIATGPADDPLDISSLLDINIYFSNTIGEENYDIGHVFKQGAGTSQATGQVCLDLYKAQAISVLTNPVGDPYDIDYVCHEIGHQFGAKHTFNGTANLCNPANISPQSAVEPGSGSTIMAYAGLCGNQDIQNASDAYFNILSIIEIYNSAVIGPANACPEKTATGNNIPWSLAQHPVPPVIPKSTPFSLHVWGLDVEADSLTYAWEQNDVGPSGVPTAPSGNAPLFRSFAAGTDSFRIFPRMEDIISGVPTLGEILPDYGREMYFRATVRDYNSEIGALAYDSLTVIVDGNSGPFRVLSPGSGTHWQHLDTVDITWDVAQTDLPPVNCALVDIALSLDGGYTYPIKLYDSIPNTGSVSYIVPDSLFSNQARIRVHATDNIFFNISEEDFSIDSTGIIDAVVSVELSDVEIFPNPFSDVIYIKNKDTESPTLISVFSSSGQLLYKGEISGEKTISTQQWPTGVFYLHLFSDGKIRTRKFVKF